MLTACKVRVQHVMAHLGTARLQKGPLARSLAPHDLHKAQELRQGEHHVLWCMNRMCNITQPHTGLDGIASTWISSSRFSSLWLVAVRPKTSRQTK